MTKNLEITQALEILALRGIKAEQVKYPDKKQHHFPYQLTAETLDATTNCILSVSENAESYEHGNQAQYHLDLQSNDETIYLDALTGYKKNREINRSADVAGADILFTKYGTLVVTNIFDGLTPPDKQKLKRNISTLKNFQSNPRYRDTPPEEADLIFAHALREWPNSPKKIEWAKKTMKVMNEEVETSQEILERTQYRPGAEIIVSRSLQAVAAEILQKRWEAISEFLGNELTPYHRLLTNMPTEYQKYLYNGLFHFCLSWRPSIKLNRQNRPETIQAQLGSRADTMVIFGSGDPTNIVNNSILQQAKKYTNINDSYALTNAAYHSNIIDPNRQPDRLIGRIQTLSGEKDEAMHEILMKPTTQYLTLDTQSFKPGWLDGIHGSLSIASTKAYGGEVVSGLVCTDGATYRDRNLDRNPTIFERFDTLNESLPCLKRKPEAEIPHFIGEEDDCAMFLSTLVSHPKK